MDDRIDAQHSAVNRTSSIVRYTINPPLLPTHERPKFKPSTISSPNPPPTPHPHPHPQPATCASPPRASRRTLPVRARGRLRRGLRSPGMRVLRERLVEIRGVVVVGFGTGIVRLGTGMRHGTGTGRPEHGDGPRRNLGSRWRLRRGWRPSGWVGVLMLMLTRMGFGRERGGWVGLVKGLAVVDDMMFGHTSGE